jgi:hypothetical protein
MLTVKQWHLTSVGKNLWGYLRNKAIWIIFQLWYIWDFPSFKQSDSSLIHSSENLLENVIFLNISKPWKSHMYQSWKIIQMALFLRYPQRFLPTLVKCHCFTVNIGNYLPRSLELDKKSPFEAFFFFVPPLIWNPLQLHCQRPRAKKQD